MNLITQEKLDKIVQKLVKGRYIHGAVFHVQDKGRNVDLVSAAGNLNAHAPYFIASINKLIISALILQLHDSGKLDLYEPIDSFFNAAEMKGVLMYRNQDYSSRVTVKHLISHTSGFPCYLLDRDGRGLKNMNLLQKGLDPNWPLKRVLAEMKEMKSKFIPGAVGRAYYAETNFRLLGNVLEKLAGKSLNLLFRELFEDLQMKNSFTLPSDEQSCVPVFFRDKEVSLQNYWRSTGNNIASTAKDQMIFLRAFFDGYFFSAEKLDEYKDWNKIFTPFQYGTGIQMVKLPKILSPFTSIPEIIGHCGSVGSVAFKLGLDLYVTGTINQSAKPGAAIRTLFKILSANKG